MLPKVFFFLKKKSCLRLTIKIFFHLEFSKTWEPKWSLKKKRRRKKRKKKGSATSDVERIDSHHFKKRRKKKRTKNFIFQSFRFLSGLFTWLVVLIMLFDIIISTMKIFWLDILKKEKTIRRVFYRFSFRFYIICLRSFLKGLENKETIKG